MFTFSDELGEEREDSCNVPWTTKLWELYFILLVSLLLHPQTDKMISLISDVSSTNMENKKILPYLYVLT